MLCPDVTQRLTSLRFEKFEFLKIAQLTSKIWTAGWIWIKNIDTIETELEKAKKLIESHSQMEGQLKRM